MPQKKYHGVLHYHRRIRHKTIRTIRVKFGEYSRGHKARTKKALSIICRHSIDASRRTCGKLDDVNRQALLSSITDKKTRSSVTISATIYYILSAHLTHNNVYLLLMNSWNKFFFPLQAWGTNQLATGETRGTVLYITEENASRRHPSRDR